MKNVHLVEFFQTKTNHSEIILKILKQLVWFFATCSLLWIYTIFVAISSSYLLLLPKWFISNITPEVSLNNPHLEGRKVNPK